MDNLALRPLTACLSKATLAAGTTTTFLTTGATIYAIKGLIYSTAAAANAATPTLDANTGKAFLPVGANKGSVFVVCYDGQATAANAIKVVQGSIEDLDGVASGANAKFANALPNWPAIPGHLCPIGYIVTKVGASGAAWTFGTSALAGPPANTLHTFVDVSTLPDRRPS
jgi:hypothetical protein